MQVSRVINVTQQVSFNEMVLMDWPTDLHFPFDTRHDSNKSSIKTDVVKDSSVRECVLLTICIHIDFKTSRDKID